MLLFCIEWQSNVQRFIMHMHSYCVGHETFCLVISSLLLSSWLLKVPNSRIWCACKAIEGSAQSRSQSLRVFWQAPRHGALE